MLQRTAKSCGPDAPMLASSSRSRVGPTGLRQDISAGDGGKQARSPGRARRKPLKPLRAGMSGDSGVLVVTRVRSTNTKCTRGRGCNGHPAFPTPSLGGRFINGSGAWRGEVVNARLRPCLKIESERSCAAARPAPPTASSEGGLRRSRGYAGHRLPRVLVRRRILLAGGVSLAGGMLLHSQKPVADSQASYEDAARSGNPA